MGIETEVLVVGGGPAGLATALELRRLGREVLVVDRSRPPIDKACGEGLMPDGVRRLTALGVRLSPDRSRPFRGIRYLDDDRVAEAISPGDHGSTFGGNPLGAAIANEALTVLVEEELIENADTQGQYFQERLAEIPSPHVKEVRGKGLLIGVELKPQAGGARRFCEALQERGILCKETHEHVIRFAPPLIVDRTEIDRVVGALDEVLSSLSV